MSWTTPASLVPIWIPHAWSEIETARQRAAGVDTTSSGGADFGAMMTTARVKIFISYRRADTPGPERGGHAARLRDSLAQRFGGENVFLDVDTLRLGVPFEELIAENLATCDVLIALIGERWASVTDEQGKRRLDDVNDYLRREVEAALERNIRVVPLLVQEAPLPKAEDLPSSLSPLVRRQAGGLSHHRRSDDVRRLVQTIEEVAAEKAGLAQPEAHLEDEPRQRTWSKPEGLEPDATETVAVLWSDVVGSTALGERFEAPEAAQIIGRFVDEMSGGVERHKGEVIASVGDGIMAVFRAPDLPPDERPQREARRALRAAQRVAKVAKTLNSELGETEDIMVDLRSGIHAGYVLAKDRESGRLLTSEIANVAARIVASSPAGGITLSHAAYRLVGGDVAVLSSTEIRVRGRAEPVTVWSVAPDENDG